MKRDNVNYLLVGLFTLTMFGILLIALFRITGRDVNAVSYYALFQQVPGIRHGTAVTYNGFRVGQVVDIEPQRSQKKGTNYRLKLDIRSDWKIPMNSIARIVAPGLLSDKVVDIEEGRASALLTPGDTLVGEGEADMFATMSRVALEMEKLSKEGVRPLLNNLNQQIESLTTALDTRLERVTHQAEQLLTNLNQQSGLLAGVVGNKLDRLSGQSERLLSNLNQSAEELNRLMTPAKRKQLAQIISDGQRATRNLAQLSEDFRYSRKDLERLLQNSGGMIQENRGDLREIVLTLRDALDSVSQNMDAILHNLESTSRNFNDFSREIRQNPGRLLGGQSPEDAATE